MCGIVGYAGGGEAAQFIISGLRRLEYRGYDSAGLAVIDKEKNSLELRRSVGKVELLAKMLKSRPVSGSTGLGHTRWATHGKPNEENAHPHTDCEGKIVVVHNGIIENYAAVKDRLGKAGHTFSSETDTEVIAHLIEEKIRNLGSGGKAWRMEMLDPLFYDAVRLALKELEGSLALGVLWTNCPSTIIAARRQSPLLLGIGEGENFLASDITALLEKTKKTVYLSDGDIAVLKPAGVTVFGADGKKAERPVSVVQWDRTMAEKGGYKHYMLKEIHEQPAALEDTMRGRLFPAGEEALLREFGLDPEAARSLQEIHIAACGTAYHAALAGRYMIEHFAGVPVSVDFASERRYRDPIFAARALAVLISQSGETADTIAAAREFKKNGVRTLAICNVLDSSLTRECDFTFYTRCGPEIGVASTKAFTGQLAALYIFAVQLAAARGKLTPQQTDSCIGELFRIPALMRRVLARAAEVEAAAKKFADRGHFLFLGRGINYPAALEGALKIKEISYVHAEGFAGGEMKHGPIAIIEEGMPVIGISPKSRAGDKIASNLLEAHSRGARIVAIANEGCLPAGVQIDQCLPVPETGEYLSPLLTALPLQLFAYYSANERGCDIDQPRNLAKSVTVE
ncbi:MAG: glutamine--fructose-6-phosphate transaminase (isomerizing) [Elusimicrobiales bacterium]